MSSDLCPLFTCELRQPACCSSSPLRDSFSPEYRVRRSAGPTDHESPPPRPVIRRRTGRRTGRRQSTGRQPTERRLQRLQRLQRHRHRQRRRVQRERHRQRRPRLRQPPRLHKLRRRRQRPPRRRFQRPHKPRLRRRPLPRRRFQRLRKLRQRPPRRRRDHDDGSSNYTDDNRGHYHTDDYRGSDGHDSDGRDENDPEHDRNDGTTGVYEDCDDQCRTKNDVGDYQPTNEDTDRSGTRDDELDGWGRFQRTKSAVKWR